MALLVTKSCQKPRKLDGAFPRGRLRDLSGEYMSRYLGSFKDQTERTKVGRPVYSV